MLAPCDELDPAAMARLVRLGGADLARRVVTLYLELTPQRLAASASGISRGDAAAVELAAHTLRSSAANVGATAVASLALEVERLAGAGALGPVTPLFERLEADCTRVTPVLEAVLSGGPP